MEYVANTQQILKSLRVFNSQAKAAEDRATKLLRQTTYWVFDPKDKKFGPSKFVGFAEMTFQIYEKAIKQPPRHARFHGQRTKQAIEKATEFEFLSDDDLCGSLVSWGERLVISDVFVHVNQNKWRFLRLP